ncbi:hypothetical protein L5G28_12240 [Gordonia sp. HY285]|uniref:hypothetical protein n=1 Tax=Gordonia liuliyuniae TaxID=2911517 RepID=UPI001F2C2C68|nr:hypothetical protein [Gordonia liuliyuniae]MCF8610918.1 hypothetical protein [Gordonia liuliyuniae]
MTRARVIAAACAVAALGGVATACSPGGDTPGGDTPGGDTPGGVTTELRSSTDRSPSGTVPRLMLVVHNDSNAACSLPSHGIGSAIVTSVTRDGGDVASTSRPVPTFAPSIDAVRAALTPLPPGEALALDIQTSTDPAAVESHRIDGGGTLVRTTWPTGDPGEYRVTAALETPPAAARDDRPPLCAPTERATATFTVE